MILSLQELTGLLEATADSFGMNDAETSSWVEHCLQVELRANVGQSFASHPVVYYNRFRNGQVKFGAKPRITKEMGGMAIMDAEGALGMYASRLAMEFACERAQETGAYTVAVQNNNDVGMLSYTTRRALDYGCVGQAFINGRPWLAPWGGTTAVYGPNALSAAIPAKKHYPILIDMGAADMGGLAAAKREYVDGEIDPGRYFDQDGTLTTDMRPKESLKMGPGGGAQRLANYKEMALAVMIDSIAGALTGMETAVTIGTPEPEYSSAPQKGSDLNEEGAAAVRAPKGNLITAYHIDHFTQMDEFTSKIDRAIDQAKSSPLDEGFEEILMPGERGFREEERRRRNGIPIYDQVWTQVVEPMCREQGIKLSSLLEVNG